MIEFADFPPVDDAVRQVTLGNLRCVVCGNWIREPKRRGRPRLTHVTCLTAREQHQLERKRARRSPDTESPHPSTRR